LDLACTALGAGALRKQWDTGNYVGCTQPRPPVTSEIQMQNPRGDHQPVRLAAAYFLFDKGAPLKPDPVWSGEYKTKRFLLPFFYPRTGTHELADVYLRPGESTNVWIGLDPEHPDEHIKQARIKENVGRVYFHLTRWTESNTAKTRWVYRKL
jgi:hypothetical protein